MAGLFDRIKGSFTALVTPFKDGAVDESAFRGLVDWQIAEGTHGLVPVGTTGESPTLSHAEPMRVVELCVETLAGSCVNCRPSKEIRFWAVKFMELDALTMAGPTSA